ncbi:MAG: teichuronic acid biosynthesis glycosyltransferase TuaH [Luteibaculaceae bacterium]|jgi:teichuronic acid biosynthesis glycosyltransferase TuaH
MNRDMLFVMHVPWSWIKQRPHFLAEELAKKGSMVRVLHPGKEKSKKGNVALIPEIGSKHFPYWLNKYFRLIQWIFLYLKSDVIWLCFPSQFAWFKKCSTFFGKKKLVYDCMDDHAHFFTSDKAISDFLEMEKKVIVQTDVLFFSSQKLMDTWEQRIGTMKGVVINNALSKEGQSEKNEHPELKEQFSKDEHFKLIYVGTISKWMDLDLIMRLLREVESIRIYLIGPCEIKLPKHPRLFHQPPVEHSYIPWILSKANALFMPFKLNALIESVDPVKAYEYIYTGKPTFLKKYGETLKFRDNAFLYDNFEDFHLEILKSINQRERKAVENVAFLKNNNWGKRVTEILNCLEE